MNRDEFLLGMAILSAIGVVFAPVWWLRLVFLLAMLNFYRLSD